ncbi:MAG: cupin domain-containing protein [Halolamina sp.]|uniref:cupin domain-containing protein n=1 Tax=Halolamina sp. TaxID=1940283 RepID=UPI002FC3CA68
MEHVSVDDVGSEEQARRLGLSNPLNTADFAINRYSLDPGEEFSGGLHTHLDQEEAFYVMSGTASFEHTNEPLGDTETVEVGPEEAVRFGPGEYQTGSNDGDEPVEALAFGAPKESEDVRVPGPCPSCGNEALQVTFEGGEMGTVCPECGTEPSAEE